MIERWPTSRSNWLVLGSLAGLCVALRLLFLATWSEDYAIVRLDPDGYWALGQNVATGRGLAWGPDGAPTAHRMPMYPLMLAAVHVLAGGDQRMALASQAAVDAMTTVAVYFLALTTIGSGRAAALAAVSWVFYLPEISQMTRFWSEPLCALLLTAGLLFFMRARQRGSGSLYGLTGLVVGGAALTRPEYLLMPVVLAIMTVARSSQAPPARRWMLGMLLVAGLGLAWLPWVARNAIVFGRLVPTTTLAGNALYAGNAGLDWGAYLTHPPNPYAFIRIRQDVGEEEWSRTRRSGEIDVDRLYFREAIRLIASHPGRFLQLSGLRAVRLWFGLGFGRANWRSLLAASLNASLLALAAVGVGIGRRRGLDVAPLLVVLAYGTAIYLPIEAFVRFAFPLVPTLSVLSALGVSGIWWTRVSSSPM